MAQKATWDENGEFILNKTRKLLVLLSAGKKLGDPCLSPTKSFQGITHGLKFEVGVYC